MFVKSNSMTGRPCYCSSEDKRTPTCYVTRSDRTRNDLGLTYAVIPFGGYMSMFRRGDVTWRLGIYRQPTLPIIVVCLLVERDPYMLEMRWYRRAEAVDDSDYEDFD